MMYLEYSIMCFVSRNEDLHYIMGNYTHLKRDCFNNFYDWEYSMTSLA